VIQLIVDDVLRGKMCLNTENGKILWSNVSRADYDKLCGLFETGKWEDYFANLMGSDGAQDLRDVG
jgi:hypothetical protein